MNGSPWVMNPLPMMSTPSSRSGASFTPRSRSSGASRLGIEICSTGTSAFGYITVSGTYAP